jgi:hypothetical protein
MVVFCNAPRQAFWTVVNLRVIHIETIHTKVTTPLYLLFCTWTQNLDCTHRVTQAGVRPQDLSGERSSYTLIMLSVFLEFRS